MRVIPPDLQGGSPGYELTSDLNGGERSEAIEACGKLAPSVDKTDSELREIYERWLSERACLVQLGYQPVDPPTFETFAADWRSPQGPWDPLMGVDTGSWSDSDYREAKDRCTLEFFTRD